MVIFNKFRNCYISSLKVIECYDLLADMIIRRFDDKKRFNDIIDRINKLVLKERKTYSKLSDKDIDSFSEELKSVPKEMITINDLRVNSRLAISYNCSKNLLVRNDNLFPTLDKDMELSVIDIINSKIIIDTYKAIFDKLNNLTCSDEKSVSYIDKLNVLNMQVLIYKFCFHELAEKLALSVYYDISKIPDIDLGVIERKILEDTGKSISLKALLNNKLYEDVIALLDSFKDISLDSESDESIYDNLFFVTQIEILLSYLTKEQLINISSYCDGLSANNKMVMNNIKRLVKGKINAVYEGD